MSATRAGVCVKEQSSEAAAPTEAAYLWRSIHRRAIIHAGRQRPASPCGRRVLVKRDGFAAAAVFDLRPDQIHDVKQPNAPPVPAIARLCRTTVWARALRFFHHDPDFASLIAGYGFACSPL
jgi:hypothetical protein